MLWTALGPIALTKAQLKEEKNVLILGHNYMHPLVFGLSDDRARGDSLALARHAAETTCPVILMDGVRFMVIFHAPFVVDQATSEGV